MSLTATLVKRLSTGSSLLSIGKGFAMLLPLVAIPLAGLVTLAWVQTQRLEQSQRDVQALEKGVEHLSNSMAKVNQYHQTTQVSAINHGKTTQLLQTHTDSVLDHHLPVGIIDSLRPVQ